MPEQTENIQNQRLVNRLRAYWDMIKEPEDVPHISKFNRNAIVDIWENCLLIKATGTGVSRMYNIEVTGNLLTTALGGDLRGKYFSTNIGGELFSRDFVAVLDSSIERKSFMISEGSFVNKAGKKVKYRDCVLPFKDSKGEVTSLVVGISWRAF
jgi:PAS domain